MLRRNFLKGALAAFAAPAIVPYANLMPVRGIIMDIYGRSPAMEALDVWPQRWLMACWAFWPGELPSRYVTSAEMRAMIQVLSEDLGADDRPPCPGFVRLSAQS